MRQRARVLTVNDSTAWVEQVGRASSCGDCKGCVSFDGRDKAATKALHTENLVQAGVGDTVIVEAAGGGIAKSLGILYGLPVLGLLLTYWITFRITGSDEASALGAVIGLVLFALVARVITSQVADKFNRPQIIAKANASVLATEDPPPCHRSTS